jgi:hypothetical protein
MERLAMLRSALTLVVLGGALGVSAPAHAQEVTVKSGTAVGNTDSADGAKATVAVRSTGAPVTVSLIVDRSTGVGHVGGSAATIVTVRYTDICETPCSFELPAGTRDLFVRGDGVTPAGGHFKLKPGPQNFVVKPGSAGLAMGGYFLVVLGGAAALTGGALWYALPDSKLGPIMTIGGGVGLGGGIAMWMVGSTSFEPEGTGHARRGPMVLGYRGTF